MRMLSATVDGGDIGGPYVVVSVDGAIGRKGSRGAVG